MGNTRVGLVLFSQWFLCVMLSTLRIVHVLKRTHRCSKCTRMSVQRKFKVIGKRQHGNVKQTLFQYTIGTFDYVLVEMFNTRV